MPCCRLALLLVAALAPFAAAANPRSNPAGEKYLAKKAGEPGVVTLTSGLMYKVLKEGPSEGAMHPTKDASCSCHYEGKLVDGTVFDSSFKRGQPTDFAPKQVIKGWTEAMQLMVRSCIHSALAYAFLKSTAGNATSPVSPSPCASHPRPKHTCARPLPPAGAPPRPNSEDTQTWTHQGNCGQLGVIGWIANRKQRSPVF